MAQIEITRDMEIPFSNGERLDNVRILSFNTDTNRGLAIVGLALVVFEGKLITDAR